MPNFGKSSPTEVDCRLHRLIHPHENKTENISDTPQLGCRLITDIEFKDFPVFIKSIVVVWIYLFNTYFRTKR